MTHKRRMFPPTSMLVAFEAVARTGSFTLAAKELSLTQSAISRQVRALEKQLDCALLVRSNRRVKLTTPGQEYVDDIRAALRTIRDATIKVITKRPDNVLRIATLPTFGTRWLMPRIADFVAKNPEITLNFTTRIGRFDLVADNLDLAIYHGSPDWPNVNCTLLMNETLVPVVSLAIAKDNGIKSPKDILRFKLLSLHSRPEAWENWFEAQGIHGSENSGMSFEHFSTLSQACIAGVGVALMPEFLIEPELERQDLVRVGPRIQNDSAYYVALPVGRGPSKAAEMFKTWLLEEVN